MNQAQLNVTNSFSSSTKSSIDLGHTVYNRVFHKLVAHNGSIWKIHPIYIKIWEVEKTLGILTLNNGGYSLFLEIPDDSWFDHLTLWSLAKNNHHLTRTTEKGNEKVMPINTEMLSNNTHYVGTILVKDRNLLKPIPKEVIYPPIPLDRINEIEKSFLTSDIFEWSSIFQLNEGQGTICVQIFLIPKDVDMKAMTPFPARLTDIQTDFNFSVVKNAQMYVIPHDKDIGYNLGIVIFLYDNPIDSDLSIFTWAKKEWFYSKIAILFKKKFIK